MSVLILLSKGGFEGVTRHFRVILDAVVASHGHVITCTLFSLSLTFFNACLFLGVLRRCEREVDNGLVPLH